MMMNEFNVEIIFQVARSPYLNLLDLGVWCSLQAKVEKEHDGNLYNAEALDRSVKRAWTQSELDLVIRKVNIRLLKVFGLIEQARGSGCLVEKERGRRHEGLDDRELEQIFARRTIGQNRLFTFVEEEAEVQMRMLNRMVEEGEGFV